MGQAAVSLAEASPRTLSERTKQMLSGAPPSQREFPRGSILEGGGAGGSSSSTYHAVDPHVAVPELMWRMKCHAWIVWLALPSWVAIQTLIPRFQATQEEGYSNLALVVVGIVEAHHFFAEARAWALATDILAPPERIVMRQLKVFKARWHLMILGFIEALDLYTDLVFPLFAATCEPDITKHWVSAWKLVPGVGPPIAQVVAFLEFWRIAVFFVLLMLLTGIVNLVYFVPRDLPVLYLDKFEQEANRVPSNEFLRLSRHASAAMMPSVANLCDEMLAQRRWTLDSSREDAAHRKRACDQSQIGYVDTSLMELREAANNERHERQDNEAKCYFTMLLLLKVVAGNCLQLWCQGAFFALAYESVGTQGRAKVILSMVLSFVMAFVRCHAAAGNIGCLGYVILASVVLFALWVGARTFHVFICEDHVWNLTSGCVASP